MREARPPRPELTREPPEKGEAAVAVKPASWALGREEAAGPPVPSLFRLPLGRPGPCRLLLLALCFFSFRPVSGVSSTGTGAALSVGIRLWVPDEAPDPDTWEDLQSPGDGARTRPELEVVVEKRIMGPKPEKTTFCSKRSALGGSGAEGEGGAEGAGAVGLEYLSSSGCSSLGNAEKSGELCRDETTKRGKLVTAGPQTLPTSNVHQLGKLWSRGEEARFLVPALSLSLCPGMSVSPAPVFPPVMKWEENASPPY